MYWVVSVYRGEERVGYITHDGRRTPWANDCKHQTRKAAEDAKITHVIQTARENVGSFPFSYTIEEVR